MTDILIRNGSLALPDGLRPADLTIDGERIAAVGAPGELRADRVVDAAGLVVLPGALDPHVHLDTAFGDWRTSDDFWSGTVPAAHGGTTSIIEFAIPRSGETTLEAVVRCRAEADRDAVVDVGLHACVTRETFADSLAQLTELPALGVGTVKVFSTYRQTVGLTLEQIGAVLERAADAGLLVLVHAEDDELINRAIAAQVAAGRLGPRGHADSRPPEAEAAAVRQIARLAARAGARLFFVHISSAEGAQAVREARAAGLAVEAETCIQYLRLDDNLYDGSDGELWICSPPLRAARHQADLWSALADGTLDLVSTDHNCFSRAQKAACRSDFRNVPNGLPGVELRLPLLIDEVMTGRLSWADLARLTAEMPARIFGQWPNKGAIAAGADADLVLVDPHGTTDLSQTHMKTDYSPFQGTLVRGAIRETWLRGRPLVSGGALIGERGSGRPLGCDRASSLH